MSYPSLLFKFNGNRYGRKAFVGNNQFDLYGSVSFYATIK
ncbi:hypothetical protein Plano_2606 [Planococcus sp. PAMC 21323]|nr:hypothetical protein Plano_2606 [Planococcus sp. PAMC 21323]